MHFMLKEGPLDEVVSFQPPLLEYFSEYMVNNMPSRRVIQTHFTPCLVPQDIFAMKGRVILLYRNPKDTVTSMYHHYRIMKEIGYTLSWNCHVENWMKGRSNIYIYCMPYSSVQVNISVK